MSNSAWISNSEGPISEAQNGSSGHVRKGATCQVQGPDARLSAGCEIAPRRSVWVRESERSVVDRSRQARGAVVGQRAGRATLGRRRHFERQHRLPSQCPSVGAGGSLLRWLALQRELRGAGLLATLVAVPLALQAVRAQEAYPSGVHVHVLRWIEIRAAGELEDQQRGC